MLRTVIQQEYFLFNDDEINCFEYFNELSCYISDDAKYLLVRLCLRKPDRWFHQRDLVSRYRTKLGDKIPEAMEELCSRRRHVQAAQDLQIKVEEEVIDLTSDDIEPFGESSKIEEKPFSLAIPKSYAQTDYATFADDGSRADLGELLDCLNNNDLRDLAADFKIRKTGLKRADLINTLIRYASGQSVLPFTASAKRKGKAPERSQRQTTLDTWVKGNKTTQQPRLRALVMEKLGGVVKLNEDAINLFRRVNIVYFRSTQYPPSILLNAILVRAKRRAFAHYQHKRTSNIWASRDALIAYEAALQLEAHVDELLDGASTVNARSRSRSRTAVMRASLSTSSPTKGEEEDVALSPLKRGKDDDDGFHNVSSADSSMGNESPRERAAREVVGIFRRIYKQWQDLLLDNTSDSKQEDRGLCLDRFHCGHVLTRIVSKGAYALGVLKEYKIELEVLEALLRQQRWRRARRGRWYERTALILMTHMDKTPETYAKAYQWVMLALQDEDTHLIYRPKLLRRLVELEKKLMIPVDPNRVYAKRPKVTEVFIEGERVYYTADLPKNLGQSKMKKVVDDKQQVLSFLLAKGTIKASSPLPDSTSEDKTPILTGKSVWVGRDGEDVTVEQLALEHYNGLGFKGFHCEGRIITTLFGLLFWDIIFAPIDGAFETPYQSAPLDIAEDTFFYSREDIAKERLKVLEDAEEDAISAMVEESYTTHEGQMCIGVRWDMFEKQDVMEIAKCIGGSGLSVICRLLCEDYAGRVAGVPDLIVWNADESSCRFVEVKGPNDRLQENQKASTCCSGARTRADCYLRQLWIDVLLQANIPTEVCHVAEKDSEATKRAGKGKGKSPTVEVSAGAKRKREVSVESEDESGVDYSQLDLEPAAVAGVDQRPQLPTISVDAPVPSTPQKRRLKSVAEVVITTPSPRRRRPTVSPEI
ncbi:hypothetical protein NM688_g3569 [Phlebia brevispora]|uniref:Uncharacterized protein n=1 Tax=Phlebia brevispora TaxID=194682 RepID=A0ACC1T5B4_9APHY|nr:hypothetical protein NM688_g3569 [Phlebia brevispora]